LLAVLRLARQYVKVALSGEGSDEVLAGYNLEHIQRKFSLIRQLQRLPSSVIEQLSFGVNLVSARTADVLTEIAKTPLSSWNVSRRNCMTWYWEHGEKEALWPDFAGSDSASVLANMYATSNAVQPLDQMLSVMQKSWLVEDLLMKADKMSMATALELRVPFLDYRLVEWANRQPVSVKIGRFDRRTVTKRVLRRFAAKRLPKRIVNRPKKGFPVPVLQWLTDETFAKWVRNHLTGPGSYVARLFAPSVMRRQLERAAAGDADAARKSWALIVLETWLREYDVNIEADMPVEIGSVVV
jgi:asparagine synthase (glutamine-hydrolysing)